MIRDIDHPAAKVMIDTFHMTIEESDIGAAIRAAGKDLIHVQVSENHRGVTGTGLTPWTSFRDALEEIHYDGSIVIESFTPENRDLAEAVCTHFINREFHTEHYIVVCHIFQAYAIPE